MNEPFGNIIGYDDIKQELSTIIGWYTDPNIAPFVRLPRGILLVGSPGQGKTLFMRAIREAALMPTYPFVSDGKQEIASELLKVFEAASKEPHGAIILIDELDTLLAKNSRASRCMEELMDGLSPQNRVLFIASANTPLEDRDPLSRPGRFDRAIWLFYPNERERHDILTHYLAQHGKSIAEDELGYFVEQTEGCSNACLSAIVTDACLRNHGKSINGEMLEASHTLLRFHELPYHGPIERPALVSCVHEIGHAILIDHYRKHYTLRHISMRAKYSHRGACYSTVNNADQTQETVIESIEIDLAGFLANKILLGVKDDGSASDLTGARLEARRLINSYGFFGTDKVLREYDTDRRNESWVTCLRNERLAAKLILQCERRASRIIRKNRDVILRLAKELQQNGFLSGSRVHEVLAETSAAQKQHA